MVVSSQLIIAKAVPFWMSVRYTGFKLIRGYIFSFRSVRNLVNDFDDNDSISKVRFYQDTLLIYLYFLKRYVINLREIRRYMIKSHIFLHITIQLVIFITCGYLRQSNQNLAS